jgi:hypothetical protein
MPDAPVVVEHDPNAERFLVRLNGETAYIQYDLDEKIITFMHTEVPASARGHGVAEAMARTALDYARDQRLTVVAFCPFVSTYIRRHREYQKLLER